MFIKNVTTENVISLVNDHFDDDYTLDINLSNYFNLDFNRDDLLKLLEYYTQDEIDKCCDLINKYIKKSQE